MPSPAQRSFARKLAAKATPGKASARPASVSQPSVSGDPTRANEYELQRASIGEDLGVLKNMQSVASKIEAKAAMTT